MSKSAALSFIASAAVLVACGGGSDMAGNDTVAPASSGVLTGGAIQGQRFQQMAALPAADRALPAKAGANVQDSLALGMQCAQVLGFFPVDYAIARGLVPPEYELVQLPTGQALLTTPLQDCGGLILNGSPVDPAPFVHFWIQVAGPEEYVEVAPGAVARRDYYYSLFEHTTRSNAARQPVKQLGFEGAPIESMTLGEVVPTANGYSVRTGGVVEGNPNNSNRYGYRWQEQIVPNEPFAAPAVHSFYHTKNPGKKGEADVRCLISVVGTGYAQLTFDARSEAAVFGSTLTGQTVDLTMQCNATMWQIK